MDNADLTEVTRLMNEYFDYLYNADAEKLRIVCQCL